MRASLVFTALLASLAIPAQAGEGVELSMRSKSMAASAMPARNAEAPFRVARDPMPELLLREEQERRGPRGACQHNATSLCYDVADGRIVYKPARKFMPQVEGLRAESISLRRDKILFKYSFR
jgi:hypothetical protein